MAIEGMETGRWTFRYGQIEGLEICRCTYRYEVYADRGHGDRPMYHRYGLIEFRETGVYNHGKTKRMETCRWTYWYGIFWGHLRRVEGGAQRHIVRQNKTKGMSR